MTPLALPLRLRSGLVLKNRLAKAAMTEGLADRRGRPGPRLERLYARWAQGGAGLLITGNTMVDGRYLERPGNLVIDEAGVHERLGAWKPAFKRAPRVGSPSPERTKGEGVYPGGTTRERRLAQERERAARESG